MVFACTPGALSPSFATVQGLGFLFAWARSRWWRRIGMKRFFRVPLVKIYSLRSFLSILQPHFAPFAYKITTRSGGR